MGLVISRMEAIPGIDPGMVERIQTAVNGYYGQFENPPDSVSEEASAPASEPPADDTLQAAPGEAGPDSEAASTAAEAAPEASENESVTIGKAEAIE